ncbi:hypothetical protein [Wolbachia endosymbiont of Atemnus politus]|nr:hypothetical protein [Wolbachia endosymbiont of Atemnus politus]
MATVIPLRVSGWRYHGGMTIDPSVKHWDDTHNLVIPARDAEFLYLYSL